MVTARMLVNTASQLELVNILTRLDAGGRGRGVRDIHLYSLMVMGWEQRTIVLRAWLQAKKSTPRSALS